MNRLSQNTKQDTQRKEGGPNTTNSYIDDYINEFISDSPISKGKGGEKIKQKIGTHKNSVGSTQEQVYQETAREKSKEQKIEHLNNTGVKSVQQTENDRQFILFASK